MARRDEDEAPWYRQLLVGLVALVVGALVVGGVVGALALGAVRVSGLGESAGPTASADPTLVMPSGRPTTRAGGLPAPSEESKRSGGPARGDADPTGRPKPSRAVTLRITPRQAGVGQRIDLRGTYPGGDGARLQVQRLEAGTWVDFPVDVPVTGRTYQTYILTSRTGEQRLRMTDKAAGRSSNVVAVRVS